MLNSHLNTIGRKRLLLSAFLFAVIGIQSAAAQGPLFLWKASSNAGDVYLLGSIHLAKPDMYPLDERIEQAFRDSENVVVEVNISPENQAKQQTMAMELGIYSDGTTVGDHLSSESFARYKAFLDERGLPLVVFQGLRPWTAAATLQELEMQRLGFDEEIGIERHFLRLAEQQGKLIHELETAEFQLEMLAGMSEELQEMFLMSTVDEYEDFEGRVDQMLSAWTTGNAGALDALMMEGYDDKPELHPLYERLISNRNIGMAEKVVDMLEGGGTWFVIAGAAHMTGAEGIVELLRNDERGFEVIQVGASE